MTAPEGEPFTRPLETEAAIPVHRAEDYRHCSTEHQKAAEEHDRYRHALEAARLELRMQKATREEYEGVPQPFTDDVDARLQPDAFGDLVRESVDELGIFGELELDCDEFPCLIAVTVDEVSEPGPNSRDLDPLTKTLERELHDVLHYVNIRMVPTPHAVVATHPSGASDESTKRLHFRVHRFLDRRTEYLQQLQEPSP